MGQNLQVHYELRGDRQYLTSTLEQFRSLSLQGNLIPVCRDILADMETPVSAFRKIDDGQTSFLLESIEGGVITSYSIHYTKLYDEYFKVSALGTKDFCRPAP